MPMKPYQKLLQRWAGEDPPYERLVQHGEPEVAALEQRYGVRFPSDFREYLLHACPTSEQGGEMDDEGVSWWGLDRVKSVTEELSDQINGQMPLPLEDEVLISESPKALFFADLLIWCWAWAICCGDGPNHGRVFIVIGDDGFVAETFGEFVDRYLAEPGGRAVHP
jgi:hypothetical protein